MAETVYVLCALTSLVCATALARRFRIQRTRLLLWSTLCFIGLFLNNALLVIDLVVVPDIDLSIFRLGTAFVAMLLLVIGLIWESR